MMGRLMKRIVVGLCFALVAGLLAVTVTVGEAGTQRQEGPVRKDCNECHESVVSRWEESAHGHAVDDPIFQESWEKNGNPAECMACHTTGYDPDTGTWDEEGIACSVCHPTPSGPHPETLMPTDPSSRLCGNCHIDTHAEWQTSAHGEGELSCVRCHNPHTTSLKMGTMEGLCITCHNQEGHFYGYTAHSQEGISCTDCHLRVSDSPVGEGHGRREHSFTVGFDTCNDCHGEGMHFPIKDVSLVSGELVWPEDGSAEEAQPAGEKFESSINQEPQAQPVQPLNYLLVAAVGMGFGMAITPWAESFYSRTVGRGRKEND